MKRFLLAVGVLSACVGPAIRAMAADAMAPLGSPPATRTIPGDVLPPLPLPFGGEINLSADRSKP